MKIASIFTILHVKISARHEIAVGFCKIYLVCLFYSYLIMDLPCQTHQIFRNLGTLFTLVLLQGPKVHLHNL